MGKRAAGAAPVFGNAAAQSVIAKSREFSMKHKKGGKPCSTQLSVNMFVHRPAIHLTSSILSIPQLMAKALLAPRARTRRQAQDEADEEQFPAAGSWRRETHRRPRRSGTPGCVQGTGCAQQGSLAGARQTAATEPLSHTRRPARGLARSLGAGLTPAAIKGQPSTGGKLGRNRWGNGFSPPPQTLLGSAGKG